MTKTTLPENFAQMSWAERCKVIEDLKRRYDELKAAEQHALIASVTERTLTAYEN